MPQISFALLVGLFGLVFGSAINAIVWRIKVGRSWVHGRSVCPDCGHQLAARDLVPVVSWLMLAGKCRYCRKPIKDHPIVEIVTALAFGLSAYVMQPGTLLEWVKLLVWLVILVLLLILAVYDDRWMILPDKVMLPLIVLSLVYTVSLSIVHRSIVPLEHAVLASVIVGAAFYLLVLFSQGRAMGGGDIKLAIAMGLLLGPRATAVAMLVAFNCAAIVGIVLIAARRKGRRDHIAFGPFLVGGTIVAYLYGQAIVTWYLRINGLY
jgi:leader peptidase (prepilin peptidase) / N-methyltransferase